MNHPKFWLQPWNVTSPISFPTIPRDHPRGLKNLIPLPPLLAEPPFTAFSLFFVSFHLFRLQVLFCSLLLISLHRKIPTCAKISQCYCSTNPLSVSVVSLNHHEKSFFNIKYYFYSADKLLNKYRLNLSIFLYSEHTQSHKYSHK